MDSYDIIIVGAGPAGSTLARIADSNLKILLLDGSTPEGKPCGGLLAPDAQKALAGFDLNLPKTVLVDPQIFSVRTIDMKADIQRRYRRMYLNVDRKGFDDWLISLIPANVTVIKAKCREIRRCESGFEVCFGDGLRAKCKQIVGADGANSFVRSSLFKKPKTRTYTAIQQWFKDEGNRVKPFYSCIFDSSTSSCCLWSIYKDGYIIFGGAFPKKNSRERFEAQKQKLRKYGLILGEPVRTEACLVLRPRSLSSFVCGKNGAYLIGEAAGFISPSSLEGISSAIGSAVALGESLSKADTARAYRRKTLRLRLKLIMKNLKCPFMYNPLLRRIVMTLGVGSIKIDEK